MQKLKNEIWLKYYTELHNTCKNCPNYHVQSFEQMKNVLQTTHRCKAFATDYKDEYSRGYYPILDLGVICPLSNKSITSKSIGQVVKLVNNDLYLETYKKAKEDKTFEKILVEIEKIILK